MADEPSQCAAGGLRVLLLLAVLVQGCQRYCGPVAEPQSADGSPKRFVIGLGEDYPQSSRTQAIIDRDLDLLRNLNMSVLRMYRKLQSLHLGYHRTQPLGMPSIV